MKQAVNLPARAWRALLVLGLLLACQAGAAPAPPPPATWAYIGWWLPDSWRNAPLDRLDRLLFFELKVGADGAIGERHGWPEQWTELRAATRRHGLPLDLTITVLDATTFARLFDSAPARARLLEQAIALARHADVAGLQVDMEVYTPLRPSTIAHFQQFIQQLSLRLRRLAPARTLSVFFPMGGASAYYDKATLAQVDYVVLQGYDAHWPGSKQAGPLAPLAGPEAVTWDKGFAAGQALGVPPARLLLSFPLYGYEWPVTGAQARSATTGAGVHTSFAPLPAGLVPAIQTSARERAMRYGVRHEQESGSASYRFRTKNGRHIEGWFEDRWSLERKADWIANRQAGGMAFFMLGYDDSQLLAHHLRQRKARKAPAP